MKEIRGARRGVGELGAPEAPGSGGKAGNREPVPARQDLLVAPRPHAPVAHGEQPRAGLVDEMRCGVLVDPESLGHLRHRLEAMQMPLPLEVRRPVEAKACRERVELFRWKQATHFLSIPGVEAAFVSLRIGIQGRVEAAPRLLHVAAKPVCGLSCDAEEKRIRGRKRRLRRDREQLSVVVKHFLEMRDHPVGVDRIPAEPAAELIVDPALGHARERERRHVERLEVGLVVAGRHAPAPQQKLEVRRVRKLRRLAESAEPAVELARQILPRAREGRSIQRGVGRRGRRQKLAEHLDQRLALPLDVRSVIAVVLGDALEHFGKRGHPVPRLRWKIRTAEERPLVARRKKHREWPAAAALREHLVRGLVDTIEVGALLAIDLDVDEELVHDRGTGRILEGFVCHHVAPVTGRVADREQDRLVLVSRPLESLRTPRMPVDRISGVLQQVRAGLVREPVALRPCRPSVHRAGAGLGYNACTITDERPTDV